MATHSHWHLVKGFVWVPNLNGTAPAVSYGHPFSLALGQGFSCGYPISLASWQGSLMGTHSQWHLGRVSRMATHFIGIWSGFSYWVPNFFDTGSWTSFILRVPILTGTWSGFLLWVPIFIGIGQGSHNYGEPLVSISGQEILTDPHCHWNLVRGLSGLLDALRTLTLSLLWAHNVIVTWTGWLGKAKG